MALSCEPSFRLALPCSQFVISCSAFLCCRVSYCFLIVRRCSVSISANGVSKLHAGKRHRTPPPVSATVNVGKADFLNLKRFLQIAHMKIKNSGVEEFDGPVCDCAPLCQRSTITHVKILSHWSRILCSKPENSSDLTKRRQNTQCRRRQGWDCCGEKTTG